MKDIIQYKNFIGSVHFSPEDKVFFGKVEGINDLITFEGTTVDDIVKSFEDAVNDYIELSKIAGKKLFKSYKGNFNVRVSPDLHKKAVQKSHLLGMSLNKFVEKAIEHEIGKE